MHKKQFIKELLCKEKILPLFYNDSIETSVAVLKTLYNAGIRLIEYTNRGANALNNFIELRKIVNDEMHDLQLGAGTIKSTVDAQLFITAGADFIVCPIINIDVAKIVEKAGLLWIPGCMTATEIFTAEANGANIVKIFPGNILGPDYIKAIKEIFPNLLFMPTGGVEVNKENLSEWFNAGVCAVGMGSKLISKSIIENNDYEKLSTLTGEAIQIIQSI
ncbi:MAG: bifunctional 4-hydroxy-2-oxoglutarate aldolase/2-dehydro-3-deoxy-phosphogluconate aldolase [Parafilimonas sp.]